MRPLANATEWIHTVDPETGYKVVRTNTMPQWAGSCCKYISQLDGGPVDQSLKNIGYVVYMWEELNMVLFIVCAILA